MLLLLCPLARLRRVCPDLLPGSAPLLLLATPCLRVPGGSGSRAHGLAWLALDSISVPRFPLALPRLDLCSACVPPASGFCSPGAFRCAAGRPTSAPGVARPRCSRVGPHFFLPRLLLWCLAAALAALVKLVEASLRLMPSGMLLGPRPLSTVASSLSPLPTARLLPCHPRLAVPSPISAACSATSWRSWVIAARCFCTPRPFRTRESSGPAPLPKTHPARKLYLRSWSGWVSHATRSGFDPADPPPGSVPQWLHLTSAPSGLSTTSFKALSWMARVAGLPSLHSQLQTPLCAAFLTVTGPAEKRGALPFSVSFVAWLECRIMDPSCPVPECIVIGSVLCLTWASLRSGGTMDCGPLRGGCRGTHGGRSLSSKQNSSG